MEVFTPKAQINILPFDLPTQALLIEGRSRGFIANYCKYLKEAQIISSIIHVDSFYLNSLVCVMHSNDHCNRKSHSLLSHFLSLSYKDTGTG